MRTLVYESHFAASASFKSAYLHKNFIASQTKSTVYSLQPLHFMVAKTLNMSLELVFENDCWTTEKATCWS
jgi:hypothetical protein